MKAQLLYSKGCPNVDAAREVLRRALAASRRSETFEEIDVNDPATQLALRGWGSPTILIDAIDVAGGRPGTDASCRIYPSAERGVPPEDWIRRAIERARPPRNRSWMHSLALVPGALLSLLPAATCPACWGAYAGLLSAVGLGFLVREQVLAPLLVVVLAAGVASIGWSTRSHRRPGPLLLAGGGSAAVVVGRLIWNVPPAVYVGAALLIGASLWNLWLKRPRQAPLLQLRLARKEGTTS